MVREASKRALGMRHFDVQLIGGIVLHNGKIAEMRTGEGKTLVATLPAYLNALTGKGVHVVTVNDYLAKRDAEWMGKHLPLPRPDRRRDRAADGAASDKQRGLRRRHHLRHQQRVRLRLPARQHGRTRSRSASSAACNYAIVDEVDSILIDEARTPLIISGQAEDRTELYHRMNAVRAAAHAAEGEAEAGPARAAGRLLRSTRRTHQVAAVRGGPRARRGDPDAQSGLLPEGASLYDPANITLMHHLNAALRAHALYHRDQHYVVQNDEVIIVDEFTGRLMHGPALVRRPAPGGRGEGRRARSRTRTRRSPRSPSRTTSACTRSSPA